MLATLVPPGAWAALPPLCPSRWFGWRCPGCGMTRALALLLHGRFRAALAANPRVLLVAPLLIWLTLAGETRRPPRLPGTARMRESLTASLERHPLGFRQPGR